MANVESLIVELDAKIDGYVDGMNKAKKKNDDFGGSSKEMAKSVVGAGVKVVGSVAAISVAVTAMSAAVTAMVLGAAQNRKELELMATQAKTSADDFQALSFATQRYGINAEQIADISKDVSDKISEFAIAGTGAFQDYADSVGLTKKAAREAADEFRTMSSEEVLGKMVSQMEAAGLSTSDMTFAMESMGSGLSKLTPLFTNGAKELNSLKKGFNDLNGSMQISNEQAKELAKVGQAYEGLTTSIDVATTAISATLAPVMNEFFNDIIKIVPTATQTLINFINSFKSAKDINKIDDVNEKIQTSTANILNLQIKLRKEQEAYNQTKDELSDSSFLEMIEKEIKAEQTRTEELNAQLKILQDKKALEDADVLTGGTIGGGGTGGIIGGGGTGGTGTADQLEEISNRYKSERELLTQKLDKELEMIGDNDVLQKQRYEQYLEDLLELDQTYDDKKLKAAKIAADKITKIDTDKIKLKKSLEDSALKTSISALATFGKNSDKAAKAAFIITQGLALSEAFVNTQAASVKALTVDPTGILSAKVQTAGALSMASIAAATLGGMGGGSGGGSSTGGGGGANIQNPPLQDFEAETSGLQLTDSTSSGAQTMRIEFINSTGDDIINSIAEGLNTAQREGRTS